MHTRMTFQILNLVIVAMVFAWPAWAQDWIESGDAGEFPTDTAQEVTGTGTLRTISGSTDTGVGDYVDAYLIDITDSANFVATTSSAWDPEAACVWDTRLYLFDPAGNPLLGNDDVPSTPGAQSYVSDPAIYPGTVDPSASPLSNGLYVLVITGWANDAVDAGGVAVIDVGSDYEALFGPNPAAGSFDHWADLHGLVQSGAYTIGLTGASFVSISCPEDLAAPAGVEQQDLNAVLNRWGDPTCLVGGANYPCPEDLAAPAGVEQQDLNAVLNRWGDPACEPVRRGDPRNGR